MASEQAKTLAAYRRRMQSAVFFLMEERACRLATEQCKYFIRAGEFGVCDGAIVIRGGPLDAGRGDAETIFSDNGAAFVMAGVDIKTIMMRCDNIRGAILSYSVTRNQLESCTALILCNPAEPDFVIFLPFYYVPGLTTWEETREANEKKETIVSMPPFRPEWSLHPAPPFPSEYVPYITPVRLLGEALKDMRLFIQGKHSQWQVRLGSVGDCTDINIGSTRILEFH